MIPNLSILLKRAKNLKSYAKWYPFISGIAVNKNLMLFLPKLSANAFKHVMDLWL